MLTYFGSSTYVDMLGKVEITVVYNMYYPSAVEKKSKKNHYKKIDIIKGLKIII